MAIVYQGAVAMTGESTLDISEQALVPSSAIYPSDTTIPGASVFLIQEAGGDPQAGGGQRLYGTATLTVAATYIGKGAVALTGASSLPVAAAQTNLVAASLSATTGLALAPWMIYGVRAAEMDGLSTLSPRPWTTQLVAAGFAPVGTLTAGTVIRRPATVATFAPSAALTVAGNVTTKGTVSAFLGAFGKLAPAGYATDIAGVTLAGTTTLTSTIGWVGYLAMPLAAAGALTPATGYTAQVFAAFSATTTLSETGTYIGVSSATLVGSSTLLPHALATYYLHAVPTLAGVAHLTTAAHLTWWESVVLAGEADLGPALAVKVRIAIAAFVATAGLEVDAWVHTLVPPGFTPSPIATLDTSPIWHLYIADTITGKVAYELPMVTQSWQSKLDDIGTAQATINVDQAYQSIASWDERDPRVLFRQFLSGPLRYSGVFAYGDQAVWAGPLGPVSVPGNSPQIQIGFSEFAYMFTKRLMLGDRNDPVNNGDLTFGPGTTQQIALDIILQSVAAGGASYGLPAYLAQPLASGGPNDIIRTYYGFDFNTVWDALSALTQEVGGPDIRFDPKLTYRSDGLYLTYDIQIGSPLIYSDTVWAWDVPANATIGWDTNMQNFATSYWGEGAGQDRTKLAAYSENPSLYDLGFPALEMADAMHSSVTDPYQLQALVDGDMLMYQQPAVKWTLKVQGSNDPYIGSFRVGDIFTVTVLDHPAVPDGTYRRRITSLSGDHTDWVSVTSSDAYTVMATTMEGVQVITNQ